MLKICKRNPSDFPPVKVLVKRDSIGDWMEQNPVPYDLELVCVYTESGERKWKLGDGVTPFNELPYVETIDDIMTFRTMYRKTNGQMCGVQIELAPQRNS